jgi:hypothetical protein
MAFKSNNEKPSILGHHTMPLEILIGPRVYCCPYVHGLMMHFSRKEKIKT